MLLKLCLQYFKASDFTFEVCSTEDCTSMVVLPSEKAQVPLIAPKFQTMTMKLENVDNFDSVFVNDFLPLDTKVRYNHMTLLKLSFPTVLYTHTSGDNIGNFHFISKVPQNSVHSCVEILSKSVAVPQSLQSQLPQYHTRLMRWEFVSICLAKNYQSQALLFEGNVKKAKGRDTPNAKP